ncbi:hypothetical protein CEXT_115531 [Caerostris extrusa]|uniref:Uncharacterized protein n=1 Tax=Caerostris extrusa TaxID=172846 RepID=A0AAV4TS68_CAEEX|nr:hypothetical protein CEXT_115531 [Caerostris extrusa]
MLVFTLHRGVRFAVMRRLVNTISTLPKSSPTTPSNLCCPTPVGKEERATRCTTTTASATTPALTYDTCSQLTQSPKCHRTGRRREVRPLRDGSERHVFMVDTCKDVYVAQSSRHVNTHIYTHCRNAAEDNDNPFLMISVTSKVTRTTYKNYFCAVCNEDIYMDQLTP